MTEVAPITSYSFCQLGQRANQEDARFPDADMVGIGARVFIVCDGVGGLDDGEAASRAVAGALGNYVTKMDLTKPFTRDDFAKALAYAYRELNRTATGHSMATTLAFVCFHGRGAMVAHIGDSRIYHIRPGVGILYRSSDHSLVNDLVQSGNLTPQQAIDDPRSNYITRCMQSGRPITNCDAATMMQITDIADGDYFFLCTDGVLHRLSEENLLAILEQGGNEESPLIFSSDMARMQAIANISADSLDNNTAYLIPIRSAAVADMVKATVADEECDEQLTTKPLTGNMSDVAVDVRPEQLSVLTTITDFFKRKH